MYRNCVVRCLEVVMSCDHSVVCIQLNISLLLLILRLPILLPYCMFFPGLLGSGKTFRKSLRNSQSIREEEEKDPGDAVLEEEGPEVAATIKDSTETEGESWTEWKETRKTGLLGLDTLIKRICIWMLLHASNWWLLHVGLYIEQEVIIDSRHTPLMCVGPKGFFVQDVVG